MLAVMSAAGGKYSACVGSFLLNHSDIICPSQLGYTGCGRLFFFMAETKMLDDTCFSDGK